jgi:cation diffusion facilitator CzcD-associated flavoprotein CzcO
MFLRSGTDWHLDASRIHTFEAFVADRGIRPEELDPIPISVFLDYAEWFQREKQLTVDERFVSDIERQESRFVATLDDGSPIGAERVVVAPGNGYFAQFPDWASRLPEGVGSHTSELVHFDGVAGERVLIVGGRQSAYEWAALLHEHGAARVDIVHRHDPPRFERVSWQFVDEYMDATLAIPGWWRSLQPREQDAIARRFWEVGRLTLEWWLTPRLAGDRVYVWPNTHVAGTVSRPSGTAVTLANGERLEVDRVLFATGYKAEMTKVPYLRTLIRDIVVSEGFPELDEHLQTSVPGLFVPGFAATRDFGPFFGFTKACPAAATLIVDALSA